jgi:cytochrome c peroxidase
VRFIPPAQFVFAVVFGAFCSSVTAATAADTPITLSDICPAGFETTAQNTCKLHTRYDQYDSLAEKGVGGLQTSLPAHREGFSPQQIDLGRNLFFDPVLSGDQTLSCASCHHPELGFADGMKRSIGTDGQETQRAAPSLWNMAFLTRFFWDDRAGSLEEQMVGPLFASDEMASTPGLLLERLNGNADYQRLFAVAFPGQQQQGVTLDQLYLSLAAFQTSLISLNSPYDRYAHGAADALSPQQLEGFNIFRSFVARCSECHTPPLFTNQQIAVIGVNEPDGRPFDPGAEVPFNNPDWRGGFKVPSLRNIARTGPYMHSGTFENLRDAAEFYTKGRGHALPEEEKARVQLHWHIWEPKLEDHELDRLVDFMQALTDESFTPAIPARVPSGLPPIGRLPIPLHDSAKSATTTVSIAEPNGE